jgi:hypothetical protein
LAEIGYTGLPFPPVKLVLEDINCSWVSSN